MKSNYLSIQTQAFEAAEILKDYFDLEGKVSILPGEIDFNFKVETASQTYVLKISRPNADAQELDFQKKLLLHLAKTNPILQIPRLVSNTDRILITEYIDKDKRLRYVRLYTWLNGRLWSSANPKKENLLYGLGIQAGRITKTLENFDHPVAHRDFEWDIAKAGWTKEYLHLFNADERVMLKHFQDRFDEIQASYTTLRKSIVHNDINDNNILLSEDLIKPQVNAIIDFGDAVYTQIINDLAISIAYAVMNKADALQASLPIIKGYHKKFPLLEEELELLSILVAMRLVISLTKSALNKQKEPENTYLLISEKAAWDVLERWFLINENIARYSFREACGFMAHPKAEAFASWAKDQNLSLQNLFPGQDNSAAHLVDMSISSTFIGHETEYNDNDLLEFRINRLREQKANAIVAGGYLETRPFYSTDAYKKEGNNGPEYRSVHLGVDFWLEAQTPVHALFDGKVMSIFNNDQHKDYGPTLILEHLSDNGIPFYSLYGHCSKSTLKLHQVGDTLKKGSLIAFVGHGHENGSWAPHLHFQLFLDRLGYQHDFPGVSFPNEANVWKSICPDPNLLFKEKELESKAQAKDENVLDYRKRHLGKGLSLSYDSPLKMLRGSGAFLIDQNGRKHLDTVNNVAHVGHEHPKIVEAGQKQMAVLNTNTRYLHENINDFTKELLNTFPKELSVVHFVNSGSEANELALRMAYTFTGQKDIIAVEVGYHGSSNACIDISSYKFDGPGGKGAPKHTHIVPLPDAYRGLFQGEYTGIKYANIIQEKIDFIHSEKRKPAAFICESIISCGGQIELPENYLAKAYDLVRKAGGICIADEVQTGCARVGKTFWGFQLHGVIPDIVTIGKPIGNGHPLAAVVCTKEVADAFANGMEYFNTFGGNPVSSAIGKEVLQIIKEEKLQENAMKVGAYIKDELLALQIDFPMIGDVRGQGLFLGFELVDADKNPMAERATYLANRMKDLGILMSTDGKDHNVLKIKPPMVFSMENTKELVYRLRTVLAEDFMRL